MRHRDTLGGVCSARMRWTIRTALPAAFCVFALAACGESDPSEPAAKSSTQTATATEPEQVSQFDRPTPAEKVDLLRALYKIDGRMAGHGERYVDRSVNTCQMLQDNKWPEPRNVATTVERFSGGTLDDFTPAQAKQVLKAVRSTFCD